MTTIIVGGNLTTGKPSGIMCKLASWFFNSKDSVSLYNGSRPESLVGANLIIWAPDIDNEEPKDYPVKDKGAVLICSKVIREDRTEADAVARIFAMHGNAVIAVYRDNPLEVEFQLIDALGNKHGERTSNLLSLAGIIVEFRDWTVGQKRETYRQLDGSTLEPDMKLPAKLIELNTILADKVESQMGDRYFGNFSTRCMRLFPSLRGENLFMFSPRNTDKRRLTPSDFVVVSPPHYYGDRKYSVDTPCQVKIYQEFSDINFMIHGHAYIDGRAVDVQTTEHYYPCGDLREVPEILAIFATGARIVNLRNHGFILASESIEQMEQMVTWLPFVQKDILR
jgi:hypothetical protein